MASNYKAPPRMDEECTYERWKKEIALWEVFTELKEEKRAPAICLSLTGKAREAALELPVEKLTEKTGVQELILKLDSLFLKDSEQRMYAAYDNFEKFKRTTDMNINDFIIEFEKRNAKLKEHKIILPDPVLAYRLLNSSEIGSDKEQLARATITTLTYHNMKNQLRKIFDDTCHSNVTQSFVNNVKIKEEEEVYFNENRRGNDYHENRRGNYQGRGWTRDRSRYNHQRGNTYNRTQNMKRKNPIDANGFTSKCIVCKSIYHWAKDCPDAEKKDVKPNYQVTLFNSEIESCYIESFLGETFNKAILDSGCINTVCGEEWMKCYLDSLDENDLHLVQEQPSSKMFRFGDGKTYNASKQVSIPAIIGERKVMIETHVVQCAIPLLLSRKSMQKAHTKIDFKKNKAVMFGKEIELMFTTSGHYFIPLVSQEISSILLSTPIKSEVDNKKIALKLHKQFGHPASSKLHKLIKDAGMNNIELCKEIQHIEEVCDTCQKYKRPRPKPIVTFPLSKDFNESIAMDLKFYKNKPILHIIDHATRFSAASVVRSKDRDVIISKVFEIWITFFGSPGQILSDNGGEFANEDFKIMGEKLNTTICNTAAESPWSNGINERHNAILGNMIEKIIDDTGCSLQVAVASAVSSKNALANVYGFSPNQLVFGKNPNFPSNLTDKLPALETPCHSQVVNQKLSAIHAARRAFIKTESSERIKRALRHQTRQSNSHIFQNGDSVYYKRESSNQWKGPGTVIGVEHQTVLIKHGSTHVKVHPCRVMLEHSEFIKKDSSPQVKNAPSEPNQSFESEENFIEKDEQPRDRPELDVYNSNIYDESDSDSEIIIPENENVTSTSQNNETEVTYENNEISASVDDDQQINDSAIRNTQVNGDRSNQQSFSSIIMPRIKSIVRYKPKEENSWKTAKILSRGGKVSGRYKDFLNIEDGDTNEKDCINWKEDVDMWSPIETETILIVGTKLNDLNVDQAKANELQKWKDHNVYTEVQDIGQPKISTRWVCTEKDSEKGKIFKARLVARGFEEDTSLIRKDSPTCNKESLRLVLAVISSKQWHLNSLDVQAAFLQGSELSRDVYLKPPREADTTNIWKLNKCVYGLNDASRLWYIRLTEEFTNLGVTKSQLDEAIFYYHSQGRLEGIITTHVDDVFWGGTLTFKENVIHKLRNIFKISKESQHNFSYLGLCLEQTDTGTELHQNGYASEIKPIQIENEKDRCPHNDLTENERSRFRSVIGQLNWLSTQSRPDVAYETCQASVSFKDAKIRDITRINKTIRKLKNETVSLRFTDIGDLKHCRILSFSDASYRNLSNEGSQGGFIMFLCNAENQAIPIQWQSKRLRRVVRSTLAAECLALLDAADASFLIKSMLEEIFGRENTSIVIECVIDNKSLNDTLHSTKCIEDRRLRVDIAALREKLKNGELNKVRWVSSASQIADCLTKNGASSKPLLDTLCSGKVQY